MRYSYLLVNSKVVNLFYFIFLNKKAIKLCIINCFYLYFFLYNDLIMNILNGFSSINDSPIWTFTNWSYAFLCLQFFVGGNWKCVSIFFCHKCCYLICLYLNYGFIFFYIVRIFCLH